MHGGGQEADGHEALLDHVLEHGDAVEEPGRHPWPAPAARASRRRRATSTKPKNHSRRSRQKATTPAGQDGEEAPAEIRRRRQRRALVAAERQEDGRAAAGSRGATKLERDEAADDADVGPHQAREVRRPLEGEPHRPGQEHHADAEPDGQPRGGMGGQPPQLGPVGDQGGDHQDHDADDDHQRRDGQQLGGEEELREDEQAEQRRPASTALWRWRIRISSRTARMSGSSMSAAVMRWANSRLVSTKGEKP